MFTWGSPELLDTWWRPWNPASNPSRGGSRRTADGGQTDGGLGEERRRTELADEQLKEEMANLAELLSELTEHDYGHHGTETGAVKRIEGLEKRIAKLEQRMNDQKYRLRVEPASALVSSMPWLIRLEH
jgi:hypothetical protein